MIVTAAGITRDRVVAHQWVDNGPGWAAVQLSSAEEVLALEPDFSHLPDAMLGVVGAHAPGAECAFEVRVFGPRVGVAEDPVTGSFNASVAQWLIGTGAAPGSYTVSQGSRLGRDGVVHIEADDAGTVWVGGASTTCIRGTVAL